MKNSHFPQFLTFFFTIGIFGPLLLEAQPQIQDFDTGFQYVNHPEMFLPNWSGNEIQEGSRRIFQASGEGLEGSHALGIQTIGSFNAEIYIKTSTKGVENPKISFFAKTNQNGSGDRPVSLFYSCSQDGGNNFSQEIQIGDDQTFQNKDSSFELFEVNLPNDFADKDQITIKLEVIYGKGSGTSARLLIDQFQTPSAILEPSIAIDTAYLQSPFKLLFKTSKEVGTLKTEQIHLTNSKIISLQNMDGYYWAIQTEDPLESHPLTLRLEELGATGKAISYTLDNDKIHCGQSFFIDAQTIQLNFTQFLDPATASQTKLFLINGNHPKDCKLLDDEYSLQVQLSKPVPLYSNVDIQIQKLKSQSGIEDQNLKIKTFYTDHINLLEVAQGELIILEHDLPLDTNKVEDLSFKIKDETFTINPIIDPDNPKRLNLSINPALKENSIYQLQIPQRSAQNGQAMPGSTRAFSLDLSPPQISGVNVIHPGKIEINFSEAVDSVMAIIPEHYSLNGEAPGEVHWGKENHQVYLQPNTELSSGKDYILKISGVEDLAQNSLLNGTFTFRYTDPNALNFKAVVINEIMAAPKKENPLPYAEYIEILNPGEDTLNLVGLQLANSKSEVPIPNFQLPPNGFLILVNQDDQNAFESYGPTLGLPSWPRFVNGGDQVKLLQNDICVDSLVYSEASYGIPSLADDGLSLEVVNPFSLCTQTLKLQASQSSKLGTPGRENSVFDDTSDQKAPQLLKVMVIDSTKICLEFDETLKPELGSTEWTIQPPMEVIQADFIPSSLTEVILTLKQPIKEKTQYSLEIKNIKDCNGNAIQPQYAMGKFQLPSLASKGDVIINEILFHPQSGTPKFVEIYNHSPKFIDLSNWKLANYKGEKINDREFLSTSTLVMDPHSHLVFTENPEQLVQVYPKAKVENLIEIPDLPSYPISGGTVILLNPEETIEERMQYSDDLHHELLKNTQGVSLERFSPEQEAAEPGNWHSAAASVGYATPGFKNSHHYSGEKEKPLVSISPKIFIPHDPLHPPFTTIRYQMSEPGFLANMSIFNTGGHLIKQICQNDIWGEKGIYTWDGTNLKGQKVSPGYYILWAEIISLKGKIIPIKKTVIVGSKF